MATSPQAGDKRPRPPTTVHSPEAKRPRKEAIAELVSHIEKAEDLDVLVDQLQLHQIKTDPTIIKVRSDISTHREWDKSGLTEFLWQQITNKIHDKSSVEELQSELRTLDQDLEVCKKQKLVYAEDLYKVRQLLQDSSLSAEDRETLNVDLANTNKLNEELDIVIQSLKKQIEHKTLLVESLIVPSAPLRKMAEGAIKALNIPNFFGDLAKDILSPKAWIKQVNSCMKLSGWDEAKTSAYAQLSLRSRAANWANACLEMDPECFDTWTKLQEQFLKRFYVKKTLAELSFLKANLVQAEKETVRDFFDRCVSTQLLLDEAWGELPATSTEDEKKAYAAAKKESHTKSVELNFITGVHEFIRSKLLIEQCKTTEEILDLAQRIEASKRDQQKIYTDTSKLEINAIRDVGGRGRNTNRGGGRGGRGTTSNRGSCFRCGDPSHYADRCVAKGLNNRGRGRGGQNRGYLPNRGRGNFSRPFYQSNFRVNEVTGDNDHQQQQHYDPNSKQQLYDSSSKQQQQLYKSENPQTSSMQQNNSMELPGLDDPYLQLSNAMINLNTLNPHAQ